MSTTTTKEYVLLSKKGLQELRNAVKQLEHDRRLAMRKLREAEKTTGHDDRLQRNELLMQLETVEESLLEKRKLLTKARLLPSKRARMKVAVGSVVDLIDQQGRLFRYTIVESIEANPSDGRISLESPLGQSLIGKTVRDVVEWTAGTRRNALQLIRIS